MHFAHSSGSISAGPLLSNEREERAAVAALEKRSMNLS